MANTPTPLEDLVRLSVPLNEEACDWRDLFHSYEDFVNAPPLRFAINGFLQENGLTMIAGPSGDGKTLIMLSMARALLEATPLFGHYGFSVNEPAKRVLYLVPESGMGPFWHRVKLFHLEEHVRDGRLFIRTLSSREPLALNDPRLLAAGEGAHVFLDTAIRFMDGDESAAEDAKIFAQRLFNLQAAGARTITGAHHSPKSFGAADYMTLENVLRGSGDIGAMLAACWGIRKTDDARTEVYVENVKARDFEPCGSFLLEGRPHIDELGTFRMIAEPGEAGELADYKSKGGRPARPNRDELRERARVLHGEGHSFREIGKQMGVSHTLVKRWTDGHGN